MHKSLSAQMFYVKVLTVVPFSEVRFLIITMNYSGAGSQFSGVLRVVIIEIHACEYERCSVWVLF